MNIKYKNCYIWTTDKGFGFFLPCKQFSLLAEAISQERQDLKAREKSQAQVIINRMETIYLHF